MGKYRTIVADPPWALEWNANVGNGRSGVRGLPYETMTVEEICGLPIGDVAERDAHLWLWTTATFLWDAPRVAMSWGFRPPSYTLVWAKPGLGVGGRFRHTVEYLLFCERGSQLPVTRRDLPTHFIWSKGEHSAKPDAFYDLVEDVSPGPYLELFARRARMGDWSYWGNQSLGSIDGVTHGAGISSTGLGLRQQPDAVGNNPTIGSSDHQDTGTGVRGADAARADLPRAIPAPDDRATPPDSQTPDRHPDGQVEPTGSAQSSHDDDDDLTAEDIDYLKAQQVWGRMGRGGL